MLFVDNVWIKKVWKDSKFWDVICYVRKKSKILESYLLDDGIYQLNKI